MDPLTQPYFPSYRPGARQCSSAASGNFQFHDAIVTIANARAKMNFRFFRNASAIGAMGVTSLQQEGGGVDPGILIEKTAEEGRGLW
ncbi:hypothetical protein HQ563_01590 [bacterium]|nr:hypothetical protein [bacterium]